MAFCSSKPNHLWEFGKGHSLKNIEYGPVVKEMTF